jgi:phage terminase large subunit
VPRAGLSEPLSNSTLSILKVDVPRAFKPLLEPKRYKGAFGGRGGAKSHFFATQMVLQCYRRLTRAVGIREIQLSIRDSVRQLLADKVEQLGLGSHFTVLDTEIRCDNGSNIVFRGMQAYNAETIKSLEGYDLAWVEEAQTLSQRSLDLLRPTIRKPGSEMWFGWNPRFRTDPIDVFFRKHPSPEKIAVEVNWRDNPWFPDVLRKDMESDKADDPERAEHVWEGGYEIGQGAILARWIERAEKAGRITDDVAYDPKGPPIEISCDIGFRDTSTWWYWQRQIGGASVIDYDRDSGLEAADWIERIKALLTEKNYRLGCIWLPHDARAKTFAAKYSAVEQFLRAFGQGKVAVVPQSSKPDRINAARTFIKKCEFNRTNCEIGLDGLRAWEFEWDEDNRIFSREPLHNWASHDGDGFSYGCQVMTGHIPPEEEKPKDALRGAENMTVDELLKMAKPVRIRV